MVHICVVVVNRETVPKIMHFSVFHFCSVFVILVTIRVFNNIISSVPRGKRQWRPYYAYLKGFLLYFGEVS